LNSPDDIFSALHIHSLA